MNFLKILTFSIFIILIFSDCKKENIKVGNGCIPLSIIETEAPIQGRPERKFNYDNGVLTGYTFFKYEYKNGRVYRIKNQENRYEEFKYNQDGNVKQSTQYRRDNSNSDFFKVLDREYIYEGSNVASVNHLLDNETSVLSYEQSSNNIDTVKRYNSDGALIKLEIMEYDDFKNIYGNLPSPKFNHFFWFFLGFENNVTRREIIDYSKQGEKSGYIYSYKYNEHGYPEEVVTKPLNLRWTTVREIAYFKCEE